MKLQNKTVFENYTRNKIRKIPTILKNCHGLFMKSKAQGSSGVEQHKKLHVKCIDMRLPISVLTQLIILKNVRNQVLELVLGINGWSKK